MILSAEDVSFSYEEDRPVLRGADLALPGGGMDFLVGPNGSGKSTLLALLAGALPPRAGRVRLETRALGEIPPGERAALLGWLPQKEEEAFGFTVAETAALGLEAGRTGLALPGPGELARVEQVLALLGLEDLAGRPLNRLSGGERQRARLAAVLAPRDRPFLLLDEPTSSLDPHRAVQVLEILEDLAREGKALLVVSHDLNLAALFGRTIHLLAEGRILASGRPDQVLRREVLEEAYGPGLVLAAHPQGGGPVVLPGRTRREVRP